MFRTLALDWHVKRLDSPYWGTRQKAAIALARLRDPRAIPALRFRVGDPVPEVSIEIEKALRHLGISKEEIIDVYIDFLGHGVDLSSFENIINGLQRLGATSDQMVDAYWRAIKKTESPSVIWDSIKALGSSRNKNAIDILEVVEAESISDPLTYPLAQKSLAELRNACSS